ncbi:MAG: efflux RND transporter permease subunit [Clostridia bacterium]|nr:efflux RND transporter permease subunit [Clostridia bacterium]
MLGKYSVKKPYTVIVGVILIIVLGVISFTRMTTDLLPNMNFPYVVVYTTYIGATPEQVEEEVTRPMEAAFATLTDVKNIQSSSRDNLAMVILQFNDTADMNTAMIEINSKITTLSAGWSDSVGAPAMMKINPDMLPVTIVSVSREDMDIYELSDYVENTLIPEYEAINGVASVTSSGVITQEVDVTIDQDRIDTLNSAILREVDSELADAEQQLNDAQAQITDGKNQLARAKKSALGQISDAEDRLDSGEEQIQTAIAQLKAQKAELQTQLDQVNAGIAQLEKLSNLTPEQKQLLSALESQLAKFRAERDRLQKALDALENGDSGRVDEQIKAAEAEKAKLQAQKEDLQQYIEDLKNADAATLEKQLAALKAQAADAQTALTFAQENLTAAQSERDAAQKKVDELKRQLENLAMPAPTEAPTAQPTAEATAAPTAEATAAPTAEATAAPTAEATAAPTANAGSGAQNANTMFGVPTANAETGMPTASAGTAVPAANEADGALAANVSKFANAPDGIAVLTANAEPKSISLIDRIRGWFGAQAEGKTEEELRAELKDAEAALAAAEEKVSAAQADVNEKQASLDDLNAQVDAKQKALDDLGGGNVEGRIQEAEREIARLDLRIAALDKEIEGLKKLTGGDGAAAEALRAAIAEMDKAIEKIESSDEYKALKLALDDDERNRQYAQAIQAKTQLEAGIEQIDSMLGKLEKGIIPGGMIEGIDEDTSLADAKDQLAEARRQAQSGFADAEQQLNDASAQLAEARREFEEKRDEALKNAGLDGVITMQTVATILGAENMSMPAGYVYDASENQYMVRVGDKFASLDELKNVKLFSLGLEGVDDVRLCDVARVEITDNSAETFTKVDGEDGILLSIEKQSTFSTTDVAKRVAEKNAELMNSESGLSIIDLFNQGDYIDIIVDSVLSNLVSGGALAILILLIFLMDYRPTIIIAFSIPLSVVAAFVCMYFTGITLNVLSLSGLALGVGMLVDNSIVAIENIYRLRNEEHLPILTACIQGVSQISGALLASTLTTICVFLPVVFVTGMAHDLFSDIGLTITYSLLASLVVAMTLVPSMAAALLKRQKKVRKQPIFAAIQRGYVRLLKGALRFKPIVLLIAIALLAVTVLQVPKMGMSFMPQVNSTQMTASLALDDQMEESEQRAQALELMNRVGEISGVQTVGLNSGGAMSMLSGNSGSTLSYYIIVDSNAGRDNVDIARDIRAIADDMKLDLTVQTSTMDISMLTGTGISVNVRGDDMDTLRSIASDVADIVRTVDGAQNVSDGLESSVPEMRITVDKEKAIDKGLTVGQVIQFVATKLAGKNEITQATLDGKNLSIYIIDGRNAGITPDDLEDLEMEATLGDKTEMVRIGDIASVEEAASFTSISRENQQRVVTVSFTVGEGYASNHVSDELEKKLADYAVPDGYEIELAGENETVTGIMSDMVFVLGIAIVLIFLIMVAQFQSFKSPIIVMFTLPLAFTGGLAALLLTGMDLSIVAMVGFLVLSGVIVNNGIVFVDSVNQMRIGGMSKREALIETGRVRLRPILMTALTTILGMSTMAFGTGMGAEMMQPMAVVVIGGLTYATLMTLFIVPILYDIVNGEKMKAREIEMIREATGLNKDGEEETPEGENAYDAPANPVQPEANGAPVNSAQPTGKAARKKAKKAQKNAEVNDAQNPAQVNGNAVWMNASANGTSVNPAQANANAAWTNTGAAQSGANSAQPNGNATGVNAGAAQPGVNGTQPNGNGVPVNASQVNGAAEMGWYGYFQPGMNPNYGYAPYGYPAPYGYMPNGVQPGYVPPVNPAANGAQPGYVPPVNPAANGAQPGYVPPVNPAANGAQPGYVPPVNPAADGAQPGYVPMANGFAPQGYPQAPYYGWYAPQGNLPQNPEQSNQ